MDRGGALTALEHLRALRPHRCKTPPWSIGVGDVEDGAQRPDTSGGEVLCRTDAERNTPSCNAPEGVTNMTLLPKCSSSTLSR